MVVTTMTHTPAPWHVNQESKVLSPFLVKSGNNLIAVCGKASEADPYNWTTSIPNQQLANARLIESAPELLEAAKLAKQLCELITKWCDAEQYDAESIMDDIVALAQDDTTAAKAIAKATGITN